MPNKFSNLPKKKNEYMITYLCKKCGFDFAVTEKQKPKCFYCDSKANFKIIKKQKITPRVIADRLKLVTDRMMDNLKKAYAEGTKQEKFEEEGDLLEVMKSAKELKGKVQSLKIKGLKKDKKR